MLSIRISPGRSCWAIKRCMRSSERLAAQSCK